MNDVLKTHKIQNSEKKHSNSHPPMLILVLLGFVFVFATIGLINDISTWKGIRPFGALSDVFAQVSGFALNTKKISKQLDGGGNLLESNDRCQVIDPNKAEIKTASQLSRLALPSLEGNMGGANTAIVLDGGYDSELNEKILKYASDLDMSYNLGMVTVNSSTSQEAAAQFIKDTNALGMLPIIRLCYAGSCGFKDQNQIIDFYKNVHSLTSSEEFFVGIIGPNEPGSGEPEIEMKGFVDGLNYDALLNETNDVAKALQGLRPGGINAGHMLIAPAVFNLTNSVNNDVKEYLYSGRTFNPEYYDYLIGNTYELSVGVSAYDFYANGAQTDGNNSLKIYADGKDIPVIVSEFGAFFENYQGRRQTAIEEQKQSFAKFCQDGNIEGVLFFRSFLNENGSVALNDELVWKDRHGMTPSEHAEIIGDCPVQKKAGFKDFSWANCNFDSCLYPKEYSTNSTATACGTEIENRTFNLENGAALKVVPDGDHYVTKKIGTVEVSMPIKQFGSNSSAGTSSLPYTPICAEVAAYYANSEVDPLNQFAGVLKNRDGSTTYAMPWLGSAINCSAELILASQEFARLNDKANLNPGSSSLETFKELSSKDNPFGTEYWEEYFSLNGGKSIYPVPWNNVNKTIQDEKALCIDSLGYCLDKGVASDTINGLRDYLPQNTPSRYRQTSCSSNAIYLENQSNYIIGPEVVVEPVSQVWSGTGGEVCRKYANRKNTDKDVLAGIDYPNQLGGANSAQYQAAALDCQIKNETKVINGSAFYCPNMAGLKLFNFCSKDKIQKGECSIPAEYAECLAYNREEGDEIYIKTDKWPDAPNYSIPGVYDSLYRMYQRLQTQMSERGLKMVFRENLGWKVEVTTKVRDAGRSLADSNDRGLPDVIPYEYAQDLDSCEVPTNIFDNGTLLAKTNPTKTEYQYYDWLGYLDILQELSSAYTKDSTFSAEKLIDNPNYGKNNAANNTRRKVLETGLASVTTSFPVLTCDQVEQWKFDENPVQSSSTDSSNQPSTQYYCPIEAGLCAKGPDVESHEGLKAIDLFSANYKDGEQNVIAPFDGKIVTAQKGNEFSYCDNGTKSGGRIYFEGKIDGKTVKLMFLHVLVDDSVKVGNEYKAGQRITRVSKLSDDDITSVNEGGCIGKDGPHLHMEIEEGQYKNNIVDFTKALGCNMQGATGLGYGDFDNYGDTCNARSNITLGVQGEVGASTSASLVLNPDAQIKPDDKLTCITDNSDNRFKDELGEFLCSKGYAIEGLCDNSCKVPPEEQINGDVTKLDFGATSCPLQNDACYQGPLGGFTHYCSTTQDPRPSLSFDLYTKGAVRGNSDLYAPEAGEIVQIVAGQNNFCPKLGTKPETIRGQLKELNSKLSNGAALVEIIDNMSDEELLGMRSNGGYIIYQGKSGVKYVFLHLGITSSIMSDYVTTYDKPGKFMAANGNTIRLYEVPNGLWTPCIQGTHLHTNASYNGEKINPYVLYGDVLGCGSTSSCAYDKACEAPQWTTVTNDENTTASQNNTTSSALNAACKYDENGNPIVDGDKNFSSIQCLLDEVADLIGRDYPGITGNVIRAILDVETRGETDKRPGDPTYISYTSDNGFGTKGPMQFTKIGWDGIMNTDADLILYCVQGLGLPFNSVADLSHDDAVILGVALCAGGAKFARDGRGYLGIPKGEEFTEQQWTERYWDATGPNGFYDITLQQIDKALEKYPDSKSIIDLRNRLSDPNYLISAMHIAAAAYYGRHGEYGDCIWEYNGEIGDYCQLVFREYSRIVNDTNDDGVSDGTPDPKYVCSAD